MKNLIRKLIPNFFISWYHLKLAFWGAVFYGFPSRKLKVIGVTGTSGKSTVVDFITRILSEAGFKTASISSVRFQIGKKEWQNSLKMTMPGRFKLQKFLWQAVKAGCQYAVLEVTSEGIKQHRHRFIDFDVAVFTNLTPEHIEAHGSFEKYRKAKGKLFQKTKKVHIVNLDDENSGYFLQFPAKEKFGYGLKRQELGIMNYELGEKVIKVTNLKIEKNNFSFLIHNSLFKIPLIGKFNIYNSLAAICVGLSQGVSLETCKKALERITGIPGRMEIVIREPFMVIVDYAHTPDSLRKVYQTIRDLKMSNVKCQMSNVICVLGACGGGRDKWKRPAMGKIAAEFCDEIILTNEDPYSENPLGIIEDIEKGFSQNPNVKIQMTNQIRMTKCQKILNRREAIRETLKSAQAGDIVIITGKGCEPWMCVAGGKKIPWNDREVVREEFKKISE